MLYQTDDDDDVSEDINEDEETGGEDESVPEDIWSQESRIRKRTTYSFAESFKKNEGLWISTRIYIDIFDAKKYLSVCEKLTNYYCNQSDQHFK